MEINSHRTELEKNVDAELEVRSNKLKKLEEETLIEKKEIDRLLKIKSLLNDSATTPTPKTQIRTVDLDFPDYPNNGNTLDKIKYMEDHLGHMWHKKEMSDLLEKAEGNNTESEHLSSKIFYYNSKKKLITVTYGNSKHFSFYTTRPEWVEKSSDGNYRIKRGHEPTKEYLDRLQDGKKSEISWKGVGDLKG